MSRSIPVLHLQGRLPWRNAPLSQADTCLVRSEESFRPQVAGAHSPYWGQIVNGATIFPRCLWFVRPAETTRVINARQPRLETDRATERQGKAPWKGHRLSGSVEAEFLFATLLSDNMLPFGLRQLSLVVLPLTLDRGGDRELLDATSAVRSGHTGLADWLRKADALWQRLRKSEVNLLDYLNWQNKLTRQRFTGTAKVLYNAQGTHVCACVVDAREQREWSVFDLPVRGFVAENVTNWFETEDLDEAHYLCAALNAPSVDEAIKPYQTKGAFGAQHGGGERHIHRRPFEVVAIPEYNRKDSRHRELARLSQSCHTTVPAFLADLNERERAGPIGRLRTRMRGDLLGGALGEIDTVLAEILGS